MTYGPTESATRADVKAMGDLYGTENTLAELAYALAKAIDDPAGDGKQLPALSKELRLVMKQIAEGHGGGPEDEFSNLGDPD